MRPLRRTMQICYHDRVFIKSFSNVPLDFGLDVPPEIDVCTRAVGIFFKSGGALSNRLLEGRTPIPNYCKQGSQVFKNMLMYSSKKIRKTQNEHLNIVCQDLNSQ